MGFWSHSCCNAFKHLKLRHNRFVSRAHDFCVKNATMCIWGSTAHFYDGFRLTLRRRKHKYSNQNFYDVLLKVYTTILLKMQICPLALKLVISRKFEAKSTRDYLVHTERGIVGIVFLGQGTNLQLNPFNFVMLYPFFWWPKSLYTHIKAQWVYISYNRRADPQNSRYFVK